MHKHTFRTSCVSSVCTSTVGSAALAGEIRVACEQVKADAAK